jgi:transposase InsO family protein
MAVSGQGAVMPWQEASVMSLRVEFVMLATRPGANKRELCRRYGISPKTGYKWLKRHGVAGEGGLVDVSRRPQRSPSRTGVQLEQSILALRDEHPLWGARKLRKVLEVQGYIGLPSPSTIQAILLRNGRISAEESRKHQPFTRFEHKQPNALWQMDFKGHFALSQGRCHPLTVLDDHSRFNLCLRACSDERTATVQQALIDTFRRYGMPQRIAVDNGAPWGDTSEHRYTALCVWLIQLNVRVSHSRPYHPQTLGKDERFHGTLDRELISRRSFATLQEAQSAFDPWRECYNLKRPHESLDMQTPATRYQSSTRSFPEHLPAVEYPTGETVRKVQAGGQLCYQGRVLKVSKAFRGQPVALRPSAEHEALVEVFFCHQRIAKFDLKEASLG